MTVINDISIGNLPFVTFDNRKKLPPFTAIYFALSPTNDVLYIGRSSQLKVRWQSHHRIPDLEKMQCASIAWFECKEDELEPLERSLIDMYQPSLNDTPLSHADNGKVKRTFELEIGTIEILERRAKLERRTLSAIIDIAIEEYGYKQSKKVSI